VRQVDGTWLTERVSVLLSEWGKCGCTTVMLPNPSIPTHQAPATFKVAKFSTVPCTFTHGLAVHSGTAFACNKCCSVQTYLARVHNWHVSCMPNERVPCRPLT
jgi:hypothetical protein